MKRPVEPLLWLLFSAGGVFSALLMPSFVFLFGLAFPVRASPSNRDCGWLRIARSTTPSKA